MSGVEQVPVEEGFVWIFTVGNLATIVGLGAGIAGIIGGIVRFSKGFGKTTGDLKDTLLLTNSKIDNLSDKVKSHEGNTTERIFEVKNQMQEMKQRIEEVRTDITKSVEQRAQEIRELNEKIDVLKDENYKISLEIARKIDHNTSAKDERMDRADSRADIYEEKLRRYFEKHGETEASQ